MKGDKYMKKVLSICCVFLLLILIGCNNLLNETDINNGDDEIKSSQSLSLRYLDFEEIISLATDVVKGKCINVIEKTNGREYEFQVLERYAGEEVSTNIFIYQNMYNANVVGYNISYKSNDINYQIGKEYYLVIKRYINVLYEHDRYTVSANLFMPADDVKKSTMYGEALSLHSDLNKNFNQTQLKDHIIAQLNKRDPEKIKLYGGQKYTTATDRQTIINEADCLLQIELIKDSYPDISEIHDIYQCKVVDVLKGNIDDNSVIEVFFAKNTAEPGQQYIVAVDAGYGEGTFLFSSKNSLFDITEYDALMEYINE